MKKIYLNKEKIALVSDCDFEYINKFSWHLTIYGYARTNIPVCKGKQRRVFMHRMIFNEPKGFDVDHKNGDRLDNRRENIRICTKSQNRYNILSQKNNTSGFKGVSWREDSKKWQVRIGVNKSRKYLGLFKYKDEAVEAYKKASLKYHKEFSNFDNCKLYEKA